MVPVSTLKQRSEFIKEANRFKNYMKNDSSKCLSKEQFDSIIKKLKQKLAKCNGAEKGEDLEDNEKWPATLEEAFAQHCDWESYKNDVKDLTDKFENQQFEKDYFGKDGNRNKNKKQIPAKRSNSVDSPVSAKKRKLSKKKKEISDISFADDSIDEKEVCLIVLFITRCQRDFFYLSLLRGCLG